MRDDARRGGRRRVDDRPTGGRQRRRPVGRAATRLLIDRRVRLLRVVFVIAFVAIGGKAIALSTAEGNLARIARSQQVRQITIPAPRGAILDRSGEDLAIGQERRTVYATPYMLKEHDPLSVAAQLADALKLTRRERRELERRLSDPESGFAYVARQAEIDRAEAALALKIPGIGCYAEEKRVYPMKTVAGQLLGFVGTEHVGLAGLEKSYDEQLAGRAGGQVVVQDPVGRSLKTISASQPVPGGNVRLTIDRAIQFMAERVLADTVRKFSAKGGTAIVMDPTSGEIYAMASAPLIDANKFGDNLQAQRNRALTDTYEPGSTFKAITVAGALSEGLVTPSTSFLLPGQLKVGDRIIHESHPRGTQRFTVRRIVAESSNIGAVTLGIKLGKQRLMKWIRAFGFGRPTGIDFPGEVAGFVLPADQWWVSTMGNVPMGQGIAVTPLQMAQAYAAIANDGVAVKPHVTMQIGAKTFGSAGQSRIVSSKVARQMRDMLSDVVSDTMGTGTAAQIAGYTVAGKTGTAQKPLPNGQGYSSYNYVASFVGMVPADDPQLVVLVMVDEPHPIWGGVVAAPAFSDIAQFALQRLEIEP